jgi:hypothetical protein
VSDLYRKEAELVAAAAARVSAHMHAVHRPAEGLLPLPAVASTAITRETLVAMCVLKRRILCICTRDRSEDPTLCTGALATPHPAEANKGAKKEMDRDFTI